MAFQLQFELFEKGQCTSINIQANVNLPELTKRLLYRSSPWNIFFNIIQMLIMKKRAQGSYEITSCLSACLLDVIAAPRFNRSVIHAVNLYVSVPDSHCSCYLFPTRPACLFFGIYVSSAFTFVPHLLHIFALSVCLPVCLSVWLSVWQPSLQLSLLKSAQ